MAVCGGRAGWLRSFAALLAAAGTALTLPSCALHEDCSLNSVGAIVLDIVDADGQPVCGASVRGEQGRRSIALEEFGCRYGGLEEQVGPWRIIVEVDGVEVARKSYWFFHDGCHVIQQEDTIRLSE